MRARLAFIAVILLALVLRLHGLAEVPFWCDEAYTALTATHPQPIKSLLSIEHSPPLYYIAIMAPWSRLGESELWFRLPSVIASIGVLLLGARLAGRLNGSPLAAALILAFNAYLVTHSREARSYMPAAFFSFWAMAEAVEIARSSSRGAWIRYGIALLAACYIHYVQLAFGIASALALLLLRPTRRTFLGIAGVTLVGLAAFLPWFSYLRAQLFEGTFYASVWSGAAIGTWRDGIHYIHRLLAWAFLYNLPAPLWFRLYLPIPLLIAVFALWRLRRAIRDEIELKTAFLMLGLLFLQAAVYWILRAVGEPVYLLALFPLLLTIVAVALSRAWKDAGLSRGATAAIGLFLLAAAAGGINETWSNRFHLEDRLTRDPWPAVRQFMRQKADPKDALVVMPGWPSAGGWYFRDRSNLYQIYLPTPYFQRVAPYEHLTVGDPIEIADEITAKHDRIWVLHFRPGHYPYDQDVIERIKLNLQATPGVIETRSFGRMTLTEYRRGERLSPDRP